MAAPVLPEDQTKVEKTFDEKAGPVRVINLHDTI